MEFKNSPKNKNPSQKLCHMHEHSQKYMLNNRPKTQKCVEDATSGWFWLVLELNIFQYLAVIVFVSQIKIMTCNLLMSILF